MIDTKAKRASVIVFGGPARGTLPFPDGAIAQADRQQLNFLYTGILIATPPTAALVNYYATVSEPSYPVATVV